MSSHEQIGAMEQAPQTASTAADSSRSSGDSGSCSSSPAAAPPSLSLAQRCYTDALTSVFAYLQLPELATITAVCRCWSAAAGKGKARGVTLQLRQDEQPSLYSCRLSSPLLRHVTGLCISRFSFDQVSPLFALPNLVHLDVALEEEQVDGSAGQWRLLPSQLQSLTVRLPAKMKKKVGPRAWKALFAALADWPTLTELDCGCSTWLLSSAVTFRNLPPLTSLKLSMALTLDHLAAIKQLPSLRTLSVHGGHWNASELSVLCRPPHRLQQLEEIDLSATAVDDQRMAELVTLKGLTNLQPRTLTASALSMSPQLKRLHAVRPNSDLLYSETGRTQLFAMLRQCASLTCLHLQQEIMWLSDAAMQGLFAAVPGLRVLQLQECAVPSLRFLSHAPLLEKLELTKCTAMAPKVLAELGPLTPQLRVLRVHECKCVHLAKENLLLRLLQPPGSGLLPHLQTFEYSNEQCQVCPFQALA